MFQVIAKNLISRLPGLGHLDTIPASPEMSLFGGELTKSTR